MNLFSMLQAASPSPHTRSTNRGSPPAMVKRRAVMKAKRIAKWRDIFAVFGGRAGTNALAGHLGRANASILKSMYDLEAEGLVRRAGVVLKAGPGKNQLIWEWVP